MNTRAGKLHPPYAQSRVGMGVEFPQSHSREDCHSNEIGWSKNLLLS